MKHRRKVTYKTEAAQLEAVRQDKDALQFIHNPTEKVKLEAVKHFGAAMLYINKPTEEMKLEAVKQNGYVLKYIHNPSEEILDWMFENYKYIYKRYFVFNDF